MKNNPIKIEVSKLVAKCLQRMIVDEIDNQELWKIEDEDLGVDYPIRDKIIKEMKELVNQLDEQGIPPYIKIY